MSLEEREKVVIKEGYGKSPGVIWRWRATLKTTQVADKGRQ